MAELADRAQRCAQQLLATQLPRHWAHTCAVVGEADKLCRGLGMNVGDREVVLTAAWVHDCGYAPTLVRTRLHPVDGADYVTRQGFREEVVALVAYHAGAAWEARERGLAEELARYRPPRRALLNVLSCADLSARENTRRLLDSDHRQRWNLPAQGAVHGITGARGRSPNAA